MNDCFLHPFLQIRQNFRASGQQDAENIYDEWLKFAENYGDVAVYAIAIVPEGMLDQLGKALPDAVQRDTGVRQPGPRTHSDTVGAMNRRRQRQRRAELTCMLLKCASDIASIS